MTGKQPFEAIVAEHGATVLRVCRAILGPVDADDAWSETFLAAMRAYPDLPASANIEAWLVTIAHRKAIDATRAAARRAVPVAQTPEGAAAGPADSPGDGLDGDLADAVTRLPAKQKQAVAGAVRRPAGRCRSPRHQRTRPWWRRWPCGGRS